MDRYEIAAQSAGNGLWDWDLSTSRIHYSPGWISMLGGAGTEVGNTIEEWFRRIHPEDSELVQREISTHLALGSAQFDIQHRMLHADGCYRWMSCRGVITRDDTGRAIRISGCHVDVTAEKVVDKLTGLPNLLLLQDRLTRSIERARKQDDFLFAVLVLDLDFFESGINRLETVNTDSLLVAAARRLEILLRTTASSVYQGLSHIAARAGGQEFVVLLDGLPSLYEAKNIADQLLSGILTPFEFHGREVFLKPSIGIALSGTGYKNADDALRDADTALYRAKSFGKSRCEIFDTVVLESSQTWSRLEQDLQDALNRKEFQVFYQPIVAISTNRIAGFEALVRWNHPSRGLVFPGDFIPAAEKTGLIIQLDRWMLQEACRQLSIWKNDPALPRDLWISVNLSGMQLTRPSLLEEFREILADTRLDANGLMLELTEGAVAENPDAARSALMQLRVLGARIGLDDFGTGYSSLAHLRRFPLDYLKIDQSFVRSISLADTQEIVRAITVMARQLGLRVIAEGIENSQQLDLLRSLDCEYGQGFLFSRAVESKQAEELLQKNSGSSKAVPETLPPVVIQNTGTQAQPRSNRRRYVFLALPGLILLLMGGWLARLNRLTSPPVAYTSPQTSISEPAPVPAPSPPKTVEMAPIRKPRPLAIRTGAPKPSGASKYEQNHAPAAAFIYPVVHNHVLGSCIGNLKITNGHLSFESERAKDGFDLSPADYSCTLDSDQLIIKSGSRTYRFKSAKATSKEENKSQLLEIFQNLSRPVPK